MCVRDEKKWTKTKSKRCGSFGSFVGVVVGGCRVGEQSVSGAVRVVNTFKMWNNFRVAKI